MLSVVHGQETLDLLYLRWFTAIEDDWERELDLRPLQWYRYEREEGCSITVPSQTTCSLRRKTGAPGDSFGFIPLESVIERVCVVRIPRQVVAKRGSAVSFDATDPKDDDSTTRFVVNNLVGPPPEELLPVVPDEVMETVREESIGMRLRPSQASMRLEAAMAAKEVEAWG